jgi:hypothetical protein
MFFKIKILFIKLIQLLIFKYFLLPRMTIILRIHTYITIFPQIIHLTINIPPNNIHNKIPNLIPTNQYILPITIMQNLPNTPTTNQSQLDTISTIIRLTLYLHPICISINSKYTNTFYRVYDCILSFCLIVRVYVNSGAWFIMGCYLD